MTIEQKIADAIDDLRTALVEGASINFAVIEVATEFGLKPDILRDRATKVLGRLEDVRANVGAQITAARDHSASKAAISEYIRLKEAVPAREWLAQKLGRKPTDQEVSGALAGAMKITAARVFRGSEI